MSYPFIRWGSHFVEVASITVTMSLLEGSMEVSTFSYFGLLTLAASAFYWLCRVVLCAKGKAVALSIDHKPNRPEERRRINALGGKVRAHLIGSRSRWMDESGVVEGV